MDKRIVDALIQYGLITNICVDAEKYKDVDDLIAQGVITIPGSRPTIDKLIKDLEIKPINEVLEETPEVQEEIIVDSPEDVTPLEETPEVQEEIIVDTPEDVTPLEETPEVPTVVEEVVEEVEETKKSTKKQTIKK